MQFSSEGPAAGWSSIKCTLTSEKNVFSLEQRADGGLCSFATPSFGQQNCLSLGEQYTLQIADESREYARKSIRIVLDTDNIAVDCALAKTHSLSVTFEGNAESEL